MPISRRSAVALVAAALAPTAALAAPIPGGTHLAWMHPDNAWTVASETVQATADGVADVATISGARTAGYLSCGGSPLAFVHLGWDRLTMPTASIEVLDGTSGDTVWEVDLNPDDIGAVLVEQLLSGDFYGDGEEEIAVVWTELFETTAESHVEIRDAATGTVLHAQTDTTERQSPIFRLLQPLEVLGEAGLLISEQRIVMSGGSPITITVEGGGKLLQLERGTEPDVVATLPKSLPMASVTPIANGFRIVAMPLVITAPPSVSIRADLRTVDLTFDENGAAEFDLVWEREGAGGNPVLVTKGDAPVVAVGTILADERGTVAGFDLDTGEKLWSNPADVSPFGGRLLAADLTGDGNDELVAGPRYGRDATGLLNGGAIADLIGIDPATGATRWVNDEKLGKIGAWGLDAADVDGDGTNEVLATYSHQEGFATCASAAEDAGLIGVYDADGTTRCRFSTDRAALDLASANVDGAPGEEVIAGTLGGNVYAFRNAEPGCGTLAPILE